MPLQVNDILNKKLHRIEKKKRKLKAYLEIADGNDRNRALRSTLKKREYEQLSTDSDTSTDERTALASKRLKVDSTEVQKKDRSKGVTENDDLTAEKLPRVRLPVDELRELRTKVIARRNQKMQAPSFYLVDGGLRAQFGVDHKEDDFRPLFAPEIQHLIVFATLEGRTMHRPSWCRLVRPGKVSHTVLVIVEGLSVEHFRKDADCLPRTRKIFDTMVEMVPPVMYGGCVSDEFLWVPLSETAKAQCLTSSEQTVHQAISEGELMPYRSLVNIFKIKNWTNSSSKLSDIPPGDQFPRTALLLSPLQMILEGYPLTTKVADCCDFVYTKDEYECVTSSSPLFAIDCEMCITTTNKSELTRVSVVNENLETVYDTLVKPYNRITNYLTQYSGITKEMMTNVSTRIEEVQKHLREIIPPDAILCGQSLWSDLNALKMIHPYVIDTSVIYNLSGVRRRKTGLKNLMKIFLNETIQNDNTVGHDSIEDSASALKLVLLKLRKGLNFGDVILDDTHTNASPITKESKAKIGHPILSYNTGLMSSLLKLVVQHEKKVAVIHSAGETASYERAWKTLENNDQLRTINVETNKGVALNTCNQAIHHDLTIAHMNLHPEHGAPELTKLDKRLRRIFKSCAPNALLMVVFSASMSETDDCNDFVNGLCMLKLKVNHAQ